MKGDELETAFCSKVLKSLRSLSIWLNTQPFLSDANFRIKALHGAGRLPITHREGFRVTGKRCSH